MTKLTKGKLKQAFRTAQIAGSQALGVAGAAAGVLVGDVVSAEIALQTGQFQADKARVKRDAEKVPK